MTSREAGLTAGGYHALYECDIPTSAGPPLASLLDGIAQVATEQGFEPPGVEVWAMLLGRLDRVRQVCASGMRDSCPHEADLPIC